MAAMDVSDTRARVVAYVSWPSAPLTKSLVLGALATIDAVEAVIDTLPPDGSRGRLIQWATYDDMDHDRTHTGPTTVLSSSYVYRKALIRKHYLSRLIHTYLVKHPDSPLRRAAPRTWEIDISFADELEDMWSDELWDLGEAIKQAPNAWWILKPGMADRGIGIRLFNSKEALQNIFDSFGDDSDGDDEEDESGAGDGTAVMTSQLRHFVIQVFEAPWCYCPIDI